MNRFVYLPILFLLFVCPSAYAQESVVVDPQDRKLIDGFFREQEKYPEETSAQRMQRAALYLLDKPYVSGTLEVNEEEQLVINLRELDCVTLVENCLALSRASKDSANVDEFVRQLQGIRYCRGTIDGYSSRLHYSSDWIRDNVEKGIFKDITSSLGGVPWSPNVSFISANKDRYPMLKDAPEELEIIKKTEAEINERTDYYYLPKEEIDLKASLIESGDIICFTTSIKGLDISHKGIAYVDNGRLTFIHASPVAGRVIVNPESLADYCRRIRSNTGIVVLRIPVPSPVTSLPLPPPQLRK